MGFFLVLAGIKPFCLSSTVGSIAGMHDLLN